MPTYKITMARDEIRIQTYTIDAPNENAAKVIVRQEFNEARGDWMRIVHTDEWVQEIEELTLNTPEQLALNL